MKQQLKQVYKTACLIVNETLKQKSQDLESVKESLTEMYQQLILSASKNSWYSVLCLQPEINLLYSRYLQLMSDCFDLSLKTISLKAKIKKLEHKI